jgi:vacuolar-type H+-ATPase subunit H
MSLRNRLLLASCQISLWGNERKDALVDAEVGKLKHVKKGRAGNWKTNLLAGADTEYEDLKKALGLCRSYHYASTLRWGKRGEQVLPSEMFLDYAKTMNQYKNLAEQRLDDLLTVWDDRVQEAKQNSTELCAKFTYPSKEALKSLCGVTIEINPLPEAGDLVLDIEDAEAQTLLMEERNRLTNLAQERATEAMQDLWQRFEKILLNAERNLSLTVGGEGRYRGEWYENLAQFAAVADKMNFQKDPKLTELVEESRDILEHGDAEGYKKSDDSRGDAEEKVKEILRKMKGIF